MTETATGTVYKIFEKQTKDGNTIYSIKLDGDPSYYSTYTTKPACNPGDVVSFSWKQNGNFKNANAKSVKVTGQGAAPAPSGGGGVSRDDYWKKKEDYDRKVKEPHLCFRSASMAAVDIVVAGLQHEAIPLGQKKSERMDIIKKEIEKTRDWLYKTYEDAFEKLEKGESLVPPNIADGAEEHTPEEGWEDKDLPF